MFHRLFCEVFDPNTTYDFLYNKYDTSYLGEDLRYIGFIAIDHKGQAVSYSGSIPFKFILNGEEKIGAHSCDHMTRSDARKKGLFVKLNDKVDDLCKTLDIPFVFGFPNQNNHPILVKYAGWEIAGYMQVFTFSSGSLPVSTVCNRSGFLKRLFLHRFKQRVSSLVSNDPVKNSNRNGILRNKNFYRYKQYSDSRTIKLTSGLVWCKLSGALLVGDLDLNQGQQLHDMITDLKTFCKKMGIAKFVFICSENYPHYKRLCEISKPIKGNGIGFKLIQENTSFDPSNIVFTWGDYDTF